MASYDEGLVKGDAVLAAAVWRNVFKGQGAMEAKVEAGARSGDAADKVGGGDGEGESGVNFANLALVVSYMRDCLSVLDRMSDGEVVREGNVVFGDPEGERGLVGLRSGMMDLPFGQGEDKGEVTVAGGRPVTSM